MLSMLNMLCHSEHGAHSHIVHVETDTCMEDRAQSHIFASSATRAGWSASACHVLGGSSLGTLPRELPDPVLWPAPQAAHMRILTIH